MLHVMDPYESPTTPPAQAPAISKEERNWAMGAHLSSFAGWLGIPFANIIAPLVIWMVKKDEMPFAAEHAKECLNFQITMTIGILICAVLMLVLIGIVGLIALAVIDVIFTIIAAIRAGEGQHYRYPFTLRFVS